MDASTKIVTSSSGGSSGGGSNSSGSNNSGGSLVGNLMVSTGSSGSIGGRPETPTSSTSSAPLTPFPTSNHMQLFSQLSPPLQTKSKQELMLCQLTHTLLRNNRECASCHALFNLDDLRAYMQNNHREECPKCHTQGSIDKLFTHNPIVQSIVNTTIMRCPNACGMRVEFELMEQHMQQVCTKQVIPCSLSNYGCTWNGPREQLPLHLQSDCTYASIVQACMAQVQEQVLQLDNLCTSLKKACEQKDLFIQQLMSQQQQLNQQIQSLQMELERTSTANAGATSTSTFVSLFGNDAISPLIGSAQLSSPLFDLHATSSGHDSILGNSGTSGNGTGTGNTNQKTISPPLKSRDNSPTEAKPAYAAVVQAQSPRRKSSSAMNQAMNSTMMANNATSGNGHSNGSLLSGIGGNNLMHSSSASMIGNNNQISHTTNNSHNSASSDSKLFLLAGGGVGSIKIWDTESAQKDPTSNTLYMEEDSCILSLKGHTRFVSALHSHDGYVCSGSGDTSIRLWDFESGECEAVLHGCEGKVGALCTHGKYLVSGSKDGPTNHKIRLWDLSKQQCVKVLHGHTDWINVLCSTNDQFLFSGSGDRSVRMWDVEKGKCLVKYENTSFVLSLHYHIESGLLYCGTYDGVIRVWDMRVPVINSGNSAGNGNNGVAKSVKAHQSGVLSLCYQNNVLCSGSKDQTIKLWDFRQTSTVRGLWSCMATMYGHTNAVKCLTPYQNNVLASGSYDRTVKLWNLDHELQRQQPSYDQQHLNVDDAASTNDTSFMTIQTGFKVYSLCVYSQDEMQQRKH